MSTYKEQKELRLKRKKEREKIQYEKYDKDIKKGCDYCSNFYIDRLEYLYKSLMNPNCDTKRMKLLLEVTKLQAIINGDIKQEINTNNYFNNENRALCQDESVEDY